MVKPCIDLQKLVEYDMHHRCNQHKYLCYENVKAAYLEAYAQAKAARSELAKQKLRKLLRILKRRKLMENQEL